MFEIKTTYVCGGVIMPVTKPVKDKAKEAELAEALTKYDPKYRFMWVLGTKTGLRISDLLSLRVWDIKKNMEVTEKKTGKLRRITLDDATMDEMRLYLQRMFLRPNMLLFPGYISGQPLNRKHVWRVISSVARSIGMEGVSPHSMRKTYATDLYNATGDVYAVQKALNHKFPSTTMSYLGKKAVYVDVE
jgi:integrase